MAYAHWQGGESETMGISCRMLMLGWLDLVSDLYASSASSVRVWVLAAKAPLYLITFMLSTCIEMVLDPH
jgi:hypothetical protein